jgi:hypothetical protein
MSKLIKPLEHEEISEFFSRVPRTDSKVRRYHDHQPVWVDMGPEYELWLNLLREKSREFNVDMEKRFRAADIPLTTKKEHPNFPLRVTFQFRPPFIKTAFEEPKHGGRRHSNAPDEITVFFHLNEENLYDDKRTYSKTFLGGSVITYALDRTPRDSELKSILDISDLSKLADHIISRYLEDRSVIPELKKIYTIQTLESAQSYLTASGNYIESSFGAVVYKNALIIILNRLLSHQIDQLLAAGELDVKKVEKEVKCLIDEFIKFTPKADKAYSRSVKTSWTEAIRLEQQEKEWQKIEKEKDIDIESDKIPIEPEVIEKIIHAQINALVKAAKDQFKKKLFTSKGK